MGTPEFIDLSSVDLTPEHFVSGCHLNKEGQRQFASIAFDILEQTSSRPV